MIEVPANEFGQIRFFEITEDLPEFVLDKTVEGLLAVFGTDALDPDFIDIVNVTDLTSMSLSDYVAQGYDIVLPDYDIPAVNGIEGFAILVMSRAMRGQPMSLAPAEGVRHVTTYVPEAQLKVIAPLSSQSAAGTIGDPPGPKPKSDARIGGMVATVALLVLFALVGVMIWVAG